MWTEGVHPDLPAQHLAVGTLNGDSELTGALLPDPVEERAVHALTVLTRATGSRVAAGCDVPRLPRERVLERVAL